MRNLTREGFCICLGGKLRFKEIHSPTKQRHSLTVERMFVIKQDAILKNKSQGSAYGPAHAGLKDYSPALEMPCHPSEFPGGPRRICAGLLRPSPRTPPQPGPGKPEILILEMKINTLS